MKRSFLLLLSSKVRILIPPELFPGTKKPSGINKALSPKVDLGMDWTRLGHERPSRIWVAVVLERSESNLKSFRYQIFPAVHGTPLKELMKMLDYELPLFTSLEKKAGFSLLKVPRSLGVYVENTQVRDKAIKRIIFKLFIF